MRYGWILIALIVIFLAAGCSSNPVTTRIIEKPIPVYCKVELPEECKTAYAVDRISVKDEPLTINRAMRIEIEERAACQIKLQAALSGCNSTSKAQ
jgi:uncharacterized protein YceK